MTSDVVLTAALRNNLLSLKSTQSSIDETQLRLATGLKVNSALDNPQSFFASEALKNRASDLTRLLDGLGQNIQVIKAADAGVTALTKLVEQADSVAQSARDALAQGQSEAKVTGSVDLRGIDDLTSLTAITTGDTLTFSITDEDGDQVDIGAYGGAAAGTAAISIDTNDSVEEIIAEINNLQLDDGNGNATGGQAFEASLNASGQLEIRTLNGGDFRTVFAGGGGVGDTDSEDLALAEALGFGGVARSAGDQSTAGDTSIEFSTVADVRLTSFNLFTQDGAGDLQQAVRSDTIDTLRDADDNLLFGGIDAAADTYRISINGGTNVDIDLYDGATPHTVQSFIDQINADGTLSEFIRADFDDATGQVILEPISAEVESIQISAADTVTANFGFGLTDSPNAAGLTGAGDYFTENIQIGSAAAILAEYEGEFNNIRTQITELVSNGDTGYRGTNLLNGDDLTSFFNEFRTSSLTTEGVTFTADGLGLSEADFSRESSVDGALAEVRAALESVRAFGSTLANDLSIIQTRQDFTTNLVNTLQEGSDKLVVADQNEEGTKLLALQTRQQLGVTSLSLASQSQQSILRLF
ncbi:MAG: flagellin [Pseudomonadota bacterium]|nr:flagellin [Pseudomonadota bacterium]